MERDPPALMAHLLSKLKKKGMKIDKRANEWGRYVLALETERL